MNKHSRIFLAGSSGLVGSAIYRRLIKHGYKNIIISKRKKLDFLDKNKTEKFLKLHRPEFVIIASAKVGGIFANNSLPANFIYENLAIELNLIHGSYLAGVKNLLFLGSSCVYPKKSKQPIKEDYLLTGPLEQTNDAYAIAKIAGIKMCQSYNEQYKTNYRCLMPTNTFGPNDNFDKMSSHFLPSLIRKFHLIKTKGKNILHLWGNGKAKRELIYVDDLASACIHFMKKRLNII